ncbi:unnamed protein product [Heterobilharzia americana]|nr:unnamed protein product [Heterobilharzia americana]
MAKSVRSKLKRRFRAIKRKKSFKKVKDQLMELTRKNKDNDNTTTPAQPVISDHMDIVQKKLPKVMSDEHGTYPVWLSKRERKSQMRMRKIQKRRSRSMKSKL